MPDNLEKISAQIASRQQTELLNVACGSMSMHLPVWLRDVWAKVLEITSDALEDPDLHKQPKKRKERIDHGI